MEIINNDPSIYTIDNFLSPSECQHFINLSKESLERALVSGNDLGFISDGRSGQNCWLKHNTDEKTLKIGQKIALQVDIPLENAEAFQVIYYDQNQEYRQHYDAWLFDGSEKSRRNMKYGGQRIKTALIYLNKVSQGGGTKFTKLNLQIEAEIGKLLVFSNVYSGTNHRHPLSEHAGLPVLNGQKWAFNLWFREESRQKIYQYPDINKLLAENNLEYKNIFTLIKMDSNDNVRVYKNFISKDQAIKILIASNFENKDKSTIWLNKDNNQELIRSIESLLDIENSYYEGICVVKYGRGIKHNNHQDAFDLSGAKGKESTKRLGQRLISLIGFITPTEVRFPKLNKYFNLDLGDLLVYYNCFDNSNLRNENMIKSFSPSSSLDQMIVYSIYVREKSRINPKLLKINNGVFNSLIDEEIIPIDEIDTKHLLEVIYDWKNNQHIKIAGFKLINKAPINYVDLILGKIKEIKDKNNGYFLNQKNLEQTYHIDEYNPVVVEQVINSEIHEYVDQYFKTNISNKVYPFGDRQSQRYKLIDEVMTRLLHLEFLPLIEKIVGKAMKPTYTYISAYVKGADLPPHTDRPECEFTCSYIIGKPSASNWNIYIDKQKQLEKYKGRYDFTPPKEECLAIDCSENGLMIFNGTDHIHYREQLEYEYYNIVLLHYNIKSEEKIVEVESETLNFKQISKSAKEALNYSSIVDSYLKQNK